jgi:hypothetical protein
MQLKLPRCLVPVLIGALALPLAAQPAKQEREAATSAGQLSEVGKGERMARQETRPGAFITPKHRQAVLAYLARNHGRGKSCLPGWARQGGDCRPLPGPGWSMGVALPPAAKMQPLPKGLASALPGAPPGNQYVLYSGDILLIAPDSRIVVDAVPLRQ